MDWMNENKTITNKGSAKNVQNLHIICQHTEGFMGVGLHGYVGLLAVQTKNEDPLEACDNILRMYDNNNKNDDKSTLNSILTTIISSNPKHNLHFP